MECIITIFTPEWYNLRENGKRERDELSDNICKRIKKETGVDFDGSDIEIKRHYDCLPMKGDDLQLDVKIKEGVKVTFKCEVITNRMFCDKSWIMKDGGEFTHVYFDAVIFEVVSCWKNPE